MSKKIPLPVSRERFIDTHCHIDNIQYEVGNQTRTTRTVKGEILFGYNDSDDISTSNVWADGDRQYNTKGNLLI